MRNMRRGFTMIELIFVIVIIGILAAVAIPKLAATRDDAKISNVVANTRTVLGDLTAFYTSQGETVFKTAKMASATNVPLSTASGCATTAAITPTTSIVGTFYLCSEAGGDTIITLESNVSGITMTAASDDTAKAVLHGVVLDPAIIGITGGAGQGKTHKLGGAGVVR